MISEIAKASQVTIPFSFLFVYVSVPDWLPGLPKALEREYWELHTEC